MFVELFLENCVPSQEILAFSAIALFTVMLPVLPLTTKGAVDKVGIRWTVTLVLMHETLQQVPGEMPNMPQPTAWPGAHATQDVCQWAVQGYVLLEATGERKVTVLVRKVLILTLKVSIRDMEWKVFGGGED